MPPFESTTSNSDEVIITLSLPLTVLSPLALKHAEQLLLKYTEVPKNAPSEHGEVCRPRGSQTDAFIRRIKEEEKEEEKETMSAAEEEEFLIGAFALHPVPKIVFVHTLNMPKRSLQAFLDNRDWINLKALVERCPEVCHQSVTMMFQGREITCLPLHAVFERPGADLSVIDCLHTAFPGALLNKDEEGDRLPLHMAAMKGASTAVMRYMVEALPQSLQAIDREGNLPLHYAAIYSCEAVVELMANLSPDACQHANTKARLPLHLLCARVWDQESLSLSLIRNIIRHYPEAVRLPERQGRLPLHLACEQGHPRQDIVKLLVNSFSAGLLHKEENAGRTPLVICEWMKSTGFRENEGVLAFLRKKTKQEKPKKNGFLGKLFNRRN
jgi:hypothetical protein